MHSEQDKLPSDRDRPAFDLPDGRRIAYRVYGDPSGRPVLTLHGTPGSRLKFAIADAAARTRGLRLISIDRWGYGSSSAHPRPSLRAFADDITRLLDALDADRTAVMGISGGGPFTVAVAGGLGQRITCAALVAPVGEMADPLLRWRDLSLLHAFAFRVLPHVPGGVRFLFEQFRLIATLSPSAGALVATRRSAPVDRRLMRDPSLRRALGTTFADGLRRGAKGAVIDTQIFARHWDVPAEAIACPTRIWIGSADRNVSVTAACRLADRIPSVTLTMLAGEGHFWAAQNIDAVLGWLDGADLAARQPTATQQPAVILHPASTGTHTA